MTWLIDVEMTPQEATQLSTALRNGIVNAKTIAFADKLDAAVSSIPAGLSD